MRHHYKLNIARVFALVMALLLLSAQWMPAVSAAEKGSCGKGLSWSFVAGTLTISGKGDMEDYHDASLAPWDGFKDEIRRLVLPDGLNSIGNRAFFDCNNLTTVTIPNSVKEIGAYAFGNCDSLAMLKLGSRVEIIGVGAFQNCTALDAVRLPGGLTELGDKAFYRCESLTTITIPQGLTQMGASVFAYCTGLVSATSYARIKLLPEWTFYGCTQLISVVLAETVTDVGNYAFKDCGTLSTVYYSGDSEKAQTIQDSIAEDIPGFENYGYISNDIPSSTDSSTSSFATENEDGTITQINTSVKQEENLTVVTEVSHTRPQDTTTGGNCSAEIKVTVENKDGWASASQAVSESLKNINDSYVTNATVNSVDVTVYMKDSQAPTDAFVENLVGRDVEVTVVSPNGSSWQLDCSQLKSEELTGNYNFSYTLDNPSDQSKKKLKTDNCYQLSFEQSAQLKTELLVQLPSSEVNRSNAFLYQIEKDGTHTRLQAVKIDQNAVAHFYLASVDKDTTYVIGINVPNEKTDDLIIPDELASDYGTSFIRVEQIQYVSTGAESSWGLTFWQVTFIMIAVLVTVIVAVGVIMSMYNKQRLKNQLAMAHGAAVAGGNAKVPAKESTQAKKSAKTGAKSKEKPAKADQSKEKPQQKDRPKTTKKK